jgi:hypothetical protein
MKKYDIHFHKYMILEDNKGLSTQSYWTIYFICLAISSLEIEQNNLLISFCIKTYGKRYFSVYVSLLTTPQLLQFFQYHVSDFQYKPIYLISVS